MDDLRASRTRLGIPARVVAELLGLTESGYAKGEGGYRGSGPEANRERTRQLLARLGALLEKYPAVCRHDAAILRAALGAEELGEEAGDDGE